VTKARAGWCRDVAEVLLHTILSTSNSQRMRSTAIHALNTLGQLQSVHVGVWLAPVLDNLQPPLMARRFVPVKVSCWGCSQTSWCLRVCIATLMCLFCRPVVESMSRLTALQNTASHCAQVQPCASLFLYFTLTHCPLLLLLPCVTCVTCVTCLQSVQHVMGQVTSLAWALKLDPNLFVAGPEVLHAAKDAWTLAEREETLLLHKLVGVRLVGRGGVSGG
jgi:hypothetical protein